MIELQHVRYFHEVARLGGFTKAARAVHVQQPSVSRAVRLLEESLGVTLLARGKRSVTLTKVGRDVFEHTSTIMRHLDAIATVADNERAVCSGPLRFAAQSAVAAALSEVSARMLVGFPDVWPMTHAVPIAAAIDPLVRGDLEFGLFYHLPATRQAELTTEELGNVPFALVVAKGASKRSSVLESFIGSREVEDEGTRSFPTLDRLRRDHPRARVRLSCNDVAAQKELVLRGLGVAVVPRLFVERELASGAMTELYSGELAFPLYLIRRSGMPLSRAATAYLEIVRTVMATAPTTVQKPRKRARRHRRVP